MSAFQVGEPSRTWAIWSAWGRRCHLRIAYSVMKSKLNHSNDAKKRSLTYTSPDAKTFEPAGITRAAFCAATKGRVGPGPRVTVTPEPRVTVRPDLLLLMRLARVRFTFGPPFTGEICCLEVGITEREGGKDSLGCLLRGPRGG